MATKTIPDGAGITNHYSAAFSPWVSEAAFVSISGLKNAQGVIDGPDKRGYATGQTERQTLTVSLASNDPAATQMHTWLSAGMSGTPGYKVTGTVTVATIAEEPVAIYELSDCIPVSISANDLGIDTAEVAMETFEISYSSMKRIGP